MDIKVGDRVRIRAWADMEKEFGLDCYGHIPCCYDFIDNMAPLCGMVATVKRIDYNFIELHEWEYSLPLGQFIDFNWSFSTDMVEKVPEYIDNNINYKSENILKHDSALFKWNFEQFKFCNYGIRCETEEEAQALFLYLEKQNCTIIANAKNWYHYKDCTVYSIDNNYGQAATEYGSVEYYTNCKYAIIPFSMIIWED